MYPGMYCIWYSKIFFSNFIQTLLYNNDEFYWVTAKIYDTKFSRFCLGKVIKKMNDSFCLTKKY